MNNNQAPIIKLSPIAIIFIVLQIIVIVVLVSIFVNLNQGEEIGEDDTSRQPKLSIEGFDSVSPKLPESSIAEIENSLISIARFNNDNVGMIDDVGAIRPESLRTYYFGDQELGFFSAVIDIPSLKQSYQVFHDYTEKKGNLFYNQYFATVSSCNSGIVEDIYPDFECKDLHSKSIYGEIINKYIGFFKLNGLKLRFIDDTFSTIEIFTPDTTLDEAKKQSIIGQVKERIEQLGVPGDFFQYKVINIRDFDFETH